MAFKPRKLKKLLSEYIKENIVVTTSGKYKPEALVCTISAMGADRILFAADYPWVTPKEAVEHVERAPISDSDKEKIYHLNAERLLNCKELKYDEGVNSRKKANDCHSGESRNPVISDNYENTDAGFPPVRRLFTRPSNTVLTKIEPLPSRASLNLYNQACPLRHEIRIICASLFLWQSPRSLPILLPLSSSIFLETYNQ